MNDALAVRLGKSGADLASDFPRLGLGYRPIAIDLFRQRLSVDELHRQKFHFSQRRGHDVQIVHLADIEVTHLAGSAGLGRQMVAIPRFGALQCDALVQFLVEGLVDQAHAAGARRTDDTEPSAQQGARDKRVEAIGRQIGGGKKTGGGIAD